MLGPEPEARSHTTACFPALTLSFPLLRTSLTQLLCPCSAEGKLDTHRQSGQHGSGLVRCPRAPSPRPPPSYSMWSFKTSAATPSQAPGTQHLCLLVPGAPPALLACPRASSCPRALHHTACPVSAHPTPCPFQVSTTFSRTPLCLGQGPSLRTTLLPPAA